jgi:serine phosphatase RsbU (regulator of sigma subunit)
MSAREQPWPRQLLVFGALGAFLTLFVAASAVFTLSGTVHTGHVLGQLSRAQRYHQDADMMHDALRADVASAQQAARTSSTADDTKVLRLTRSHARQFGADLEQLRKVDLPPDVAGQLRALSRSRQAYVDLAVRLVETIARTGNADVVEQSNFQRVFDIQVARQSAVTTALADTAARMEDAQAKYEGMVSRVLVVASAIALAGWALLVGMLRRAGMRLYDALGREAEQRAVAEQLQLSLLPERLPDIPGLRLAARTRTVNSAMRVGGDWYDVISLPSGDVGLVVGDVVGHDLRAATAMGQLRASLRAFAVYEPSPAAVLARVNTVADLLEVTDLTTCLYAVVNPATRTVRWSSAGHLNPLVVGTAGEGRLLLGDPGPPIGVSKGASYVDRTYRIQDRGLLMLYTDGLVERRSCSITDGLSRLESIPGPHTGPEGLCDEVLSVLLEDDTPLADDVTLLALQA